MGLFNKKAKESKSPAKSEFDEDMIRLLARDDVQGPSDICRIEYEKALSLIKEPTPEKVHRAYDRLL